MTFGEKLQALRRARGWTQEQLAEQIGVSRQSLSKWESNAATPDTERVVALSRLFGVTTDYLLLEECSDGAASEPSIACAPTETERRRRLCRFVGGGMMGISVLAFLVLGILSSVFPVRYLSGGGPPGTALWRYRDGLPAFLTHHNMHWLFNLLLLLLLAGIAVLFWPKLRGWLEKAGRT